MGEDLYTTEALVKGLTLLWVGKPLDLIPGDVTNVDSPIVWQFINQIADSRSGKVHVGFSRSGKLEEILPEGGQAAGLLRGQRVKLLGELVVHREDTTPNVTVLSPKD